MGPRAGMNAVKTEISCRNRNRTHFLGRPDRSLVTIQTELSTVVAVTERDNYGLL